MRLRAVPLTALISLPTDLRLCDYHSGLTGGSTWRGTLTVKGLCPSGACISDDHCQNNNPFVNSGSSTRCLGIRPVPTMGQVPCWAVGKQQVWPKHGDAPGQGGLDGAEDVGPPPAVQGAPSPQTLLSSPRPRTLGLLTPPTLSPTRPPEEVSDVETGRHDSA